MSKDLLGPAPRDFVGYGPLTEPEALAVYNFTLQHNFRLILAYHSQGEVIYWQFQNYNPPGAFQIGTQFANVSGYSLEPTPYNSSFAGYKDWFIQNYNRPGYTIEVGLGTNPLPMTQFNKIYEDNLGILVFGNGVVDIIKEYFGGFKNYTIISSIIAQLGFMFATFVVFLLLYKFMPKHKVTFKSQTYGALFGAVALNVISFIFSRYLTIFKGFSITYGSLTTLMLVMMWTYSCFYTVFLGAELNKFMSKN